MYIDAVVNILPGDVFLAERFYLGAYSASILSLPRNKQNFWLRLLLVGAHHIRLHMGRQQAIYATG